MRKIIITIMILLSGCYTLTTAPIGSNQTKELQRPIQFGFDQSSLNKASKTELKKKAEILRARRSIELTIEGHTDRIGPDLYNLWLGDRRARSVKVELVRLGVDPTRLTVVSHGEKRPKALGNSRHDHATNRRVEFVIR